MDKHEGRPRGRGKPSRLEKESKKPPRQNEAKEPSFEPVKQIEDTVLTPEQREQWRKLKGEPFKGELFKGGSLFRPGRPGPMGPPWQDGKPHR